MTTPRVHSRSRLAAEHDAAGPQGSSAPALHVVTFGCQMNKYDSLYVEGRFVERGYRLTADLDQADVVLFNTCSVREHAEERVYSWLGELRRAKERRPGLVIGVMGCLAQRAEEEVFRRAAHVDVVCGTRRLQELPDLVEEVRLRRSRPHDFAPEERRLLDTDMEGAFAVRRAGETYMGGLVGHLAVMRGCDLNCTFCIVPTVRGRVQSRPIAELVDEARWMVDGGAQVVTLLGQTVNSYGEDLEKWEVGAPRHRGRQGRPALADLLHALQGVAGLERIRLITLHPAYVTRALARAMAECDKVERFLPLPAQSGSDEVLRRMKRGYTVELYRRRLELLRSEVPDLELGSDWIVGFPGETEGDFAESEALLAEIGCLQSFVFQYDPRPGTAAAALPDDVPPEVKKERNRRLLARAAGVALGRTERWIGRTVEVLAEEALPKRPGLFRGRTRHGIQVSFPGGDVRVGERCAVTVVQASPFGLAGRRAPAAPLV